MYQKCIFCFIFIKKFKKIVNVLLPPDFGPLCPPPGPPRFAFAISPTTAFASSSVSTVLPYRLCKTSSMQVNALLIMSVLFRLQGSFYFIQQFRIDIFTDFWHMGVIFWFFTGRRRATKVFFGPLSIARGQKSVKIDQCPSFWASISRIFCDFFLETSKSI